MCATVRITFGGVQRRIIIRPAPPNEQVQDTAHVIDARVAFSADENLHDPKRVHQELAKLRERADAIAKILENRDVLQIHVQCREGRSRSPRCVGAFLMLHCSQNLDEAMAELTRAYDPSNRTDGCDQTLNSERVEEWLRALAG